MTILKIEDFEKLAAAAEAALADCDVKTLQGGLAPDEQPKHIQEKSTKYISSKSIDDWMQSLSQIIKTYKIEKKLEY